MPNDLVLYEAQKPEIVSKRMAYEITVNGNTGKLQRGTDFGVIPKTKKPSLYKSGAEKIAMTYGLLQHYSIESKTETTDPKNPFFYYLVKCELVKINPVDGREYVFTSGYGSANTSEKRNGFNGAYDAANSTLKMAQKRALVSAAISIGGISDMFTQDMENEEFMNKAKDLVETAKEDSPVTANQIKRLYAIAESVGMNAKETKDALARVNIASTKDIKQKDYEKVCDWIRNGCEGDKIQ